MEYPGDWDRLTAALYHSAGSDEEVWRFLREARLVRHQGERDLARFSRIRARVVTEREAVPGPSVAWEVATELSTARLTTADARLPDPHGTWAGEAWQRWRKRALRRRTVTRWLHPFRRPGRFAAALGQHGFEASIVRHELEGRVEHGPVRGDARCPAGDGVVALLAGRKLGWVVPAGTGCAGWFKGDWISAWSVVGDVLHIEYWLPPRAEELDGPFRIEPVHKGPQHLRVTASLTDIDEFVARAGRALPERAAGADRPGVEGPHGP